MGTSSSTADIAKKEKSDCPQATGSGSRGKRIALSKAEIPSPSLLIQRREGPPTNCRGHLKLSCLSGEEGAGWVPCIVTMKVVSF